MTRPALAVLLFTAAITIGLLRHFKSNLKPTSLEGSTANLKAIPWESSTTAETLSDHPGAVKGDEGKRPTKRKRVGGRQLDSRHPLNRVILSNYEWAKKTVREGGVATSELAEAHEILGFMFISQEDWAEAEKHIRQSISLGKDDPANRANLAKASFKIANPNGELREAEPGLQERNDLENQEGEQAGSPDGG